MTALIYDTPLEIPARTQHSATVVVLHGLGDDCDGWSFVAHQNVWGQNLPHVKFIFPSAPTRAVTRNMGMRMPAWFDIDNRRGDERREDEQGITESCNFLTGIVAKEIAGGIDSSQIAFAGFSQGGALALSMLRSSYKLGGIIGMSCYLPQIKDTPIVSEINRNTPVLLCHGTSDDRVKYSYAQKSYNILCEEMKSVELKEYPMGHSSCPEELKDTRMFLESVLGRGEM